MPKMVYQWKDGARYSVDPQVAGEEIERLRSKANGLLAASAVVDAARYDRHPLHSTFEWDDSIAGEKWRVRQARDLIGHIVIISGPKSAPQAIRAFVNVQRGEVQGYTSTAIVVSDAELRQQIVQKAVDELIQWRGKYGHYDELRVYSDAISGAGDA